MLKRFKVLIAPAGVALVFAGCLSGADQQAEARAEQEKRVTFITETSKSAAAAAGVNAENPFHAEIVASLDALGCPKLSRLFTDLLDFQGSEDRPLPASFVEYLACFGVSGSGTLDDIDVVYAKFENPTQLLDCICGGTGLSDLYLGGNFALTNFQGSTSAAAGVAFDGKSSSSAGSSFDGKSSSGAGSSFDGKSSSGAGTRFGR
jgi:hypothetical protein